MIPRAKAQQELLDGLNDAIKSGKKWEDVAVISPKKGKNSWTFREMYDAIAKDVKPEEYSTNPIDDKIIIAVYMGLQGISESMILESIAHTDNSLKLLFDESVKTIIIPRRDTDKSWVECINPQLVTEEKYKEAKEAVENLKKMLEEMK